MMWEYGTGDNEPSGAAVALLDASDGDGVSLVKAYEALGCGAGSSATLEVICRTWAWAGAPALAGV